MKWIIKDWAGNRMFSDKTFDSFEDGWEFVCDFARKQLGEDCSDKDFTDFVGEYYVEKEND